MTTSLLTRQLARLHLTSDTPPGPQAWREFLDGVERAYLAAEQERYRLERSIEISSREMRELHDGLEHRRARLQAILAAMGDGLCVADEHGRLTTLNPAGAEMLGWTEAEVAGDNLADICSGYRIHAFERRHNIRLLRNALATGSHARDDDARFVDRHLKSICTAWVLTPLRQGDVLVGSVLLFRDIGAYRNALNALRESEARFRAAFESSVIGMLRITSDGRIAECNPALQRILGLPANHDAVELAALSHPDDWGEAKARLDELFAGRRDQYQMEQRFIRSDGKTVWTSLSMAMVKDPRGSRSVAIGTIEDMSHRRALEVELRHAQKLESVGLLAAGIAHEINTPVQFVGDNVQFLSSAFADLIGMLRAGGQREGSDVLGFLEEQVPRAIAETLDGIGRVATIVRALKNFAHPTDQADQVDTDINQALTNTITVARSEFKYVADIETDFAELPLVRCHPGDINQVFLNLLVNAAHAISDVVAGGGKRGLIKIHTARAGDRVVVSFSDTGGGIPLAIRGRIFDPFFTTKPVGKGTGQGLSIVRAVVVDKHGGTVRFDSTVGSGTTFYVELPIGGRDASDKRAA